jgi:hypothetical protein
MHATAASLRYQKMPTFHRFSRATPFDYFTYFAEMAALPPPLPAAKISGGISPKTLILILPGQLVEYWPIAESPLEYFIFAELQTT